MHLLWRREKERRLDHPNFHHSTPSVHIFKPSVMNLRADPKPRDRKDMHSAVCCLNAKEAYVVLIVDVKCNCDNVKRRTGTSSLYINKLNNKQVFEPQQVFYCAR